MAYFKFFDKRFGDLYEIYTDDVTGDFEAAVRSVGEVGRDPIYYDRLSDIPPSHRNQIESMIWANRQSNSQQ